MLTPARDEEGEIIKWPEDIVFYDPETLQRNILIPARQLTPDGTEKPLTVEDYRWSEERSKLLIYTNSVKVWRTKSRGDYWVLDIGSNDLWQLGGPDAVESTLQFAKFSPDGTRVAYVRENNIYVQDTRRPERPATDQRCLQHRHQRSVRLGLRRGIPRKRRLSLEPRW